MKRILIQAKRMKRKRKKARYKGASAIDSNYMLLSIVSLGQSTAELQNRLEILQLQPCRNAVCWHPFFFLSFTLLFPLEDTSALLSSSQRERARQYSVTEEFLESIGRVVFISPSQARK
jgi:hypothetical protein